MCVGVCSDGVLGVLGFCVGGGWCGCVFGWWYVGYEVDLCEVCGLCGVYYLCDYVVVCCV